MLKRKYYVYILASKRDGVLYIGVTGNLLLRIYAHKEKLVKGFTKKYSVIYLVYFEEFESIEDAIVREKRFKKWRRQWKIELIEKVNPEWRDLYDEIKYIN